MTPRREAVIFITVVVAQFCGTSLWFTTNAILPQLQKLFVWPDSATGYLTIAIQLGFIAGTLVFAIKGIADKHSPSKVFMLSCLLGAIANSLSLIKPSSLELTLVSRCLTGFFLAGIYPIGMKIAADYRQQGLGNWLGTLVGALVLGTAFPHGLKLFSAFEDFNTLTLSVSGVAIFGGVAVFALVPDGPYRNAGKKFELAGIKEAFRSPGFRGAAFGYFGHMWELYAFWAFVPWMVFKYGEEHRAQDSALSFMIIALGTMGCIAGGLVSGKMGSRKVAMFALIASGACCLLSPLIFNSNLPWLFAGFMMFWGLTVVADSPQFSALIANYSPAHVKGSAITIVTSIGFAITIFSIQLLTYFQQDIDNFLGWLLLPGPIIGTWMMTRNT